jgi:phage antirepressor YoqD-like protein
MPITAILNHTPTAVEKAVTQLGYNFELWSLRPSRKQGKSDVIYGFNSLTELQKASISTSPILFETPTVVNMIRLNHPNLIYADAIVQPDGLIFFTPINKDLLKKALNSKFTSKYMDAIKVKKSTTTQFGANSKLAVLMNAFLATIPSFVHEATMVAFVYSMKHGWKQFRHFLYENRLVTSNGNLKQITALIDYLKPMRRSLFYLVKEDKNNYEAEYKELIKSDESYKTSVRRAKVYLKYWGQKDIRDYLDFEKNVNLKTIHGEVKKNV